MTPAVLGLLTALGWGTADFIARFTGRAMGHMLALLGMLLVGSILLPIAVWQLRLPLVWEVDGWWLLLLTGTGVTVATMLLYWGLARGPVTIVAPIVSSYPAFNLLLALGMGVRPTAVQWGAMGAVVAGVATVAVAARHFEGDRRFSRTGLYKTVRISLASSLAFAITVAAAQHAGTIYGELQTVCLARWISLIVCGSALFIFKQRPSLPLRWWPVLALQGLLDAGAYVALARSGTSSAPEIAAVVASTFGAVTVLLARVFLKEAMTWLQWAGIWSIVCGISVLAAT
jgi:drug/metabolite transporter (DMT)-like permease